MDGTSTAVRISRRTFLLGAIACGGCAIVGEAGQDVTGLQEPGSFGDTISVGPTASVTEELAETGFLYVPEGRAWIVAVPEEWREPLKAVTDELLHAGIDAGYAALFQTCPHMGCRIPECIESGQFECPCDGSVFGPLGEKRSGPAPRGMDRFEAWVENDELFVATGNIIEGLPLGTELGEAAKPGCTDIVGEEGDG